MLMQRQQYLNLTHTKLKVVLSKFKSQLINLAVAKTVAEETEVAMNVEAKTVAEKTEATIIVEVTEIMAVHLVKSVRAAKKELAINSNGGGPFHGWRGEMASP
jgi:hypothetical protein